MSHGREIITFQFGHYSNFVGAHWWNIQEDNFVYDSPSPSEINHDVLFREGINHAGAVTFTPRCILVDLKGSLKHLSTRGELYEEPSTSKDQVLWPENKVELIEDQKEEKSKYISELDNPNPSQNIVENENLDADIKVWPDFLKTRFHPRTVNISNEFQFEDETKPFDVYHFGLSLWNENSFGEEIIDGIRQYAEECDNMQGFHILADSLDGFSGLSVACLQHLADEYANKPRLVFSLAKAEIPNQTPLQSCIQSINQACFFADLSEYASLFVPLSLASNSWRNLSEPRKFSSLNYKPYLNYHTSSILAVALDTISLQYRLRSSPESLNELCHVYSRLGRRAIAGSLHFPFPLKDNYLLNFLENWEGPYWQSLTPKCQLDDVAKMWMQSIVLRGIPSNKLRNPLLRKESYSSSNNYAYMCSTIKELFTWFMACSFNYTASNVSTFADPLKLERPFPKIIVPNKNKSIATDRGNYPVMAGLHSSREIGIMLENLHKTVNKFTISKFKQFSTNLIEESQYKESLDQLLQFKDCYNESVE